MTPANPERVNFIVEMTVKLAYDPLCLNKILWTDESRFHNKGTVNRRNCHYWSAESPKWMREIIFQTIWSVKVWFGLFNGHLIGMYLYKGSLSGVRYLDILQNILSALLEDIPLNERETMWSQQDGTPPPMPGKLDIS